MAESGIDFFLMENMWADNESRVIAAEAAMATGLPVWVGFTASVATDSEEVRMSFGDDRNAYSSGMGMPMWTSDWRTVDHEMSLADGIREIAALNPDAIGIFHSRISETTSALRVTLEEWSGPIVLYPDAGRADYLETWQDSSFVNEESAEELTHEAGDWIEKGAQVIGTCCGFGANYINALRGAIPSGTISPPKAA